MYIYSMFLYNVCMYITLKVCIYRYISIVIYFYTLENKADPFDYHFGRLLSLPPPKTATQFDPPNRRGLWAFSSAQPTPGPCLGNRKWGSHSSQHRIQAKR